MLQGKAALAYEQIERLIVVEDVAPGALVSESVLMEKTGLGRTPVREALQQLARNRMVEVHPNKGVLVPPASVEAQLRMLELRRALEALTVRLACKRATPADHDRMTAMIERLDSETFTLSTYLDTVTTTHHLLVAACHNEYVEDAMAPLQGLSRRFWHAHVRDVQAEIQRGSLLHADILRAVTARDPDGAEQASHALIDYLVAFSFATINQETGSR
ncbi:GntR family transcriptional regulator [Tersicoccus sp. Bi-70]|uniref:GntR family transcriptional regulator n=1 Tax=Tersicoccus sp. Bi-70 TaxID=1897634 RepID=UPI0009756945|nr:GntR family transcriptional regulator [Tersicoccus sp. Bi-70]OMH30588.1 GntR family transcriptional regulator [Tersicoccus sp. Bi-70]